MNGKKKKKKEKKMMPGEGKKNVLIFPLSFV